MLTISVGFIYQDYLRRLEVALPGLHLVQAGTMSVAIMSASVRLLFQNKNHTSCSKDHRKHSVKLFFGNLVSPDPLDC